MRACKHDTVGIDLVAMNVNDLICTGAKPLMFLDYFSTGVLDLDVAESVISGIAEGCRQAGCALVGGETAEMPDMYRPGDYDLAGFCVGTLDQRRAIDSSKIACGDAVLGLPSNGLHSNGFSLVRRLLITEETDLHSVVDELGLSLAEELLRPTLIYTSACFCTRRRRSATRFGSRNRWRSDRESTSRSCRRKTCLSIGARSLGCAADFRLRGSRGERAGRRDAQDV